MTPSPYNIIYCIDGLGMGGAERMMVPILKHLDRQTFAPRVCVFQERNGNPIAKALQEIGIPVDLLLIPYLRDFSALPRLRSYLQKHKAHLVHTQLEFADILGGLAAKSLGLPGVSTIHTMPAQDELTVKGKLHQEVEMFCLRNCLSATIAVSEEARQFHLRISRAKPQSVETIYNGIDLSHFNGIQPAAEAESIRAEFHLPPQAQILITVAVLREAKGIQYMIEALPGVLAQAPQTYYLIVGDGAHRTALEEAARQSGAQDHIVFAGQRSDIPRLLAGSDIFVLPTLTEALPTVLAEAMAARLPLLASQVGGVPEMLTHERNGLLVEPGQPHQLTEAALRLLQNPQERAQMSAAGWQIVNEKFNITSQAENLKKLYLRFIHP
jgi:glycosyltransferase involved in cell wall biosynthesis